METVFIVDPARCIGCQACVQACAECGTHRGTSMIHLEYVDRANTVQTTPQVCMHCEDPTCAQVCPADAIKQTPDGVVQSSLKPRCIGCQNCVMACPFGVPKYVSEFDQMMKCDMCYDRTALGKRPMCATVCPSEALYYGPLDAWERRRRGRPVNLWRFGNQSVSTKVALVMPENASHIEIGLADLARRRGEELRSEQAAEVA
ncbi:MAG TPA: 4Fe-4S dicluster domain-containing protein [Armatimonadota bacterium]|jgi:Fe-S-cluster-containing dehydrogenase component